MSLNYVKPTLANGFYVIRVQPAHGLDHGQSEAGAVSLQVQPSHEYEATLETLDAKVCVTAKASFAASSSLQYAGKEGVKGSNTAYAEFREWMWPSRQRNSQIDA